MERQEPGPGQESVRDYPRPPRVESSGRRVRITFDGRTIVDTTAAVRVLETSHPPVYYVPLANVERSVLVPSDHHSVCEFKGMANYYHLVSGDRTVHNAAWYYPDPSPGYESLRDMVAFYPALVDEARLDDERVRPQEGHFYGGWITDEIVGPFKGAPTTRGW
jgi:uncharacterized protein (DUF427 family)